MMESARRYIQFPKYALLPALINTLGTFLPLFLVMHFFTVESTGLYNFARQVAAFPFLMISASLGQVLFQRFSAMVNQQVALMDYFNLWLRKLVPYALLYVLVVAAAGPVLFEWVFGPAWMASGRYAQVFALPVALQCLISPLSVALPAIERMKRSAVWPFLYVAMMLSTLLFDFKSIFSLLWFMVAIEALAYIGYGLIIRYEIIKYDEGIKSAISPVR
jgi:O-antigen/teichoic acid export membrane protein